jgi:hypothetical protein
MRCGEAYDYDPVPCRVDAFSHDSWGYASAGTAPGDRAPNGLGQDGIGDRQPYNRSGRGALHQRSTWGLLSVVLALKLP